MDDLEERGNFAGAYDEKEWDEEPQTEEPIDPAIQEKESTYRDLQGPVNL